ncbi:MAG TPA: hypothetical protein VLG49_00115 [Rhabdochlamydiaceae bacterium]|nr:hypothetical protein [Rhabdochlamydiaceae bacterium]
MFQKLVLGNAGAADLQQATPAPKQGMCKHMSDAGGWKNEDAGAGQNQFLKHVRYKFVLSYSSKTNHLKTQVPV